MYLECSSRRAAVIRSLLVYWQRAQGLFEAYLSSWSGHPRGVRQNPVYISEKSYILAAMDGIEWFKTLANDVRLPIILLVAKHNELCVCDLMAALALSQPKISRHLALLRSQEVVVAEKRGIWVYYRLNEQLPQWCQSIVRTTLSAQHAYVDALSSRIEGNGLPCS